MLAIIFIVTALPLPAVAGSATAVSGGNLGGRRNGL